MGFKTKYHLMLVRSIAACSKRDYSAILSTFFKLPFVIMILVLSTFEWPIKIGFQVTVLENPSEHKEFNIY